MDAESEKELEQMRKLDRLRKLVQTILRSHLLFLGITFFIILCVVLTFVIFHVTHSQSRYLARLTLCYQPKQTGKIGQYDDKYVYLILNRQTTRMNFVKTGDGKEKKRARIAGNIQIETKRKHPHNFFIRLNASSESEAVALINEFAQICIHAYIKERTYDLRKWKKVLDDERAGIAGDIRKCSDEIIRLTLPLQVVSLDKDYEMLRMQISEFQTNRTRLKFTLDNLNSRKNELEKALHLINPAVLNNRDEIKVFFTDLEKLDSEIDRATELYTDENPKMIALKSRRKALKEKMDRFMKSKGIQSADPQTIRNAEKIYGELKTILSELDAKNGEMQVLDGELEVCNKRFRMISECQPRIQTMMQQKANLQESLRRLDESIAEINYMLLMVKEDLFVNEKASSAVGNRPFTKKNIAICLFSALVFVAFCAALTVVLEIIFGRVANAEELQIYDEFHYLGVLPASEEMFNSDEREKMTFNKLFHKFELQGLHVIFTGALPGAKIINELFEFFEWNFAMSGHRMLIVDMVLAEGFDKEPDSDCETMIVTFSAGKCYLPIASGKFLSPSELELLKNDFQILKKNYDYIFIRHVFSMKRSILFLEQIAEFCDALLVAVGAGKTPRKSLRSLLTAQGKIKIPVMTIMTDHFVKKLNKDLNQEAES